MLMHHRAALTLHRATGRLSRRARAFEVARAFGQPRGVLWLRDVLRAYAAQGKVVFVSSHLLSEMQLMADHVVRNVFLPPICTTARR